MDIKNLVFDYYKNTKNKVYQWLDNYKAQKQAKQQACAKAIEDLKIQRILTELLVEYEGTDYYQIAKIILNNQIKYNQLDHIEQKKQLSWMLPTASMIVRNLEPLQHIVGIQPLQGPTGLVYSMRYTRNDQSDSRSLTLQIVSQAVEANTQKFHTVMTMETYQDISKVIGPNIEKEIIRALANELTIELETVIISDLIKLTGVHSQPVCDLDLTNPNSSITDLVFAINRATNSIAKTTRRGKGNFVIIPSNAVSILQSAPKSVFEPVVDFCKKPTNIMLVGIMSGTINVYSYNAIDDVIIVGYKGRNGEVDTGYVYCPYTLLMSSGVSVDPVTFQPKRTLLTRHGKAVRNASDEIVDNSSDYYRSIRINIKDA